MSEGIPELQSQGLKADLGKPLNDTGRVIEGMIGRGEGWDKSLAQAVMNLHDGVRRRNENKEPLSDTNTSPKVIFVTATSAIPYAAAIKECWKIAYPQEQSPKFFFVDVSKNRFGLDTEKQRILQDEKIEQINLEQIDKMKMIGEKHEAFDNAAVFEEWRQSGATVRGVQDQMKQAGFTDVNYVQGNWGYQHPWDLPENTRPIIRKGDENSAYRPLVININESSRNLVADMKEIGRQMGNEILQRIQDVSISKPTNNIVQPEPNKTTGLRAFIERALVKRS